MTILVKNKHRLLIDDFEFECCIGENGSTINKIEGDKKTPKGIFSIENLYYRSDRLVTPKTKLKTVKIKNYHGWCDDIKSHSKYNKLISIKEKVKHEKLYRRDNKYDLLIPIKYNFNRRVIGLGSCIFIHLTNNYKPTAGCIALSKKDFLIMLKLINKKTKIQIS